MKKKMESFPQNISFCYPWRSYQKRVLASLEEHLANRHLHLVAPPGSGKTVLGLEVMLRINRPTIILAPTLTIKQQWASRFAEMFLGTTTLPDWISTSIKQPAFVTITTYQALHSLISAVSVKKEDEEQDSNNEIIEINGEEGIESEDETEDSDDWSAAEATLAQLKSLSIHTIIFDEAHHLRVSWWQSAMELCRMLSEPTKISLTATPPYDVNPREWQRYMALCGPIDEEISVPELVKHGELCPHQDYISLTAPTKQESAKIKEFRSQAATIKQELLHAEYMIKTVVNHPYILDSSSHIEDILTSPGYYSSMVIFLRATNQPVWKEAVKVLGLKESEAPELTFEWLEELLNGVLFKDKHIDSEMPQLKDLKQRLSRMGMLERRKVYLRSTPSMDKMLIQSSSKLTNIGEILQFERSVLGEQLRMVILTDYIRKEDMPKQGGDEKPLHRLGVVPVFEMIRRKLRDQEPSAADLPIGILSGSLVVLPLKAADHALELAATQGITLSHKPLDYDPKYVIIDIRDSNRSGIVAIVTEVFSHGNIQVLIGTAALLGEGWDAPSINSLIMASYVGTFMLSNQMRGRAIRTDRSHPEKTGAIWHLACIDTEAWAGGEDFASLSRRFRSLVGLSVIDNTIESGIARMGLDSNDSFKPEQIRMYNEDTLKRARQRDQLKKRWNTAIDLNSQMTEELQIPSEGIPKPVVYKHTVKAVLLFALFMAISACNEAVLTPAWYTSDAPGWFRISLLIVVSGLIASPWLYKAIKMKLRHHSLERSFRETALIVHTVLFEMKQMKLPPHIERIQAEEKEGMIVCWLTGGSTEDKTVFLNTLQQLLEPIDNPKYFIYSQSRKWFVTRRDYYPVPDEIGRRKEHAERFAELWQKHIGPAELVYTRTIDGRKQLLTARSKALSSKFIPKSERISAWR